MIKIAQSIWIKEFIWMANMFATNFHSWDTCCIKNVVNLQCNIILAMRLWGSLHSGVLWFQMSFVAVLKYYNIDRGGNSHTYSFVRFVSFHFVRSFVCPFNFSQTNIAMSEHVFSIDLTYAPLNFIFVRGEKR